MKKCYSKPDIVFESFSLSTDIAGGCGVPTATPQEGDCGYEISPDWFIFITGVTGCDEQIDINEDGNDGICYDVPIPGNELFNS